MSAAERSRGFIARARIAALLFVLVWVSCSWFGSQELNANNATRMFAAMALVEDGNAQIDPYAQMTVDKAQFGGHTYLDKAPGMTLMTVPVVAVVDYVTGKSGRVQRAIFNDIDPVMLLRPRLRLAAALGSALPTAIAASLLFVFLTELTGSSAAGLFAAIGYALGTTVWGWSTTIFGHAPDAALFLIATILIWRGTQDARPGIASAFAAGLALGWAFVIEYQSAAVAAVLGCWALWRLWRYPASDRMRAAVAAVIGAVIALIPLGVYNMIAFGTLFKLGYEGVVGWNGMQQGLFGITYPKPMVLLKILFGLRRGLIWVAPILVLAPFGLARLIRRCETRDLGITASICAAIPILINASYFYWDGGSSTGPRLSVPAIGLLAIGLGPLWTMLRTRAARIAAACLLGVSVVLNLVITATAITAPEGFPNPLWSWVFKALFLNGRLNDFPSQFWDWSPWAGFALYLAVAAIFALAVYRTMLVARLADQPAGRGIATASG